MPHARNTRRNQVQVKTYAAKVIQFGNVQGVRGAAIAVMSEGNKPPWRMITYGTLTRSIYLAHEQAGEMDTVKETIQDGLTVEEYREDTPDDIIAWLRDFYNKFHEGVGVTFLQKVTDVPDTDAMWKVHARKKGIPLSRSDATAPELEAYIKKFHKD
eukprot:9481884-Pyramimonas_sp.AAC.1